MSEILLHHYAVSPFAEKMRAVFGYKQLDWRSVDIPVVMPKPDLVALTGGYRKTPVLQIGCDVYCDTQLIVRVLDAVRPELPVLRAEHGAVAMAAGRWFDRYLFLAVIGQLFDPDVAPASAESLGGVEQATAFAADRTPMMKNAPVRPPRPADGRVLVEQVLMQLDAQLETTRPFLFGAEPSWADFCAYAPLWTMRQNRVLAKRVGAYREVCAWADRIAAFGHGAPNPLSAGDALALARNSQPRPWTEGTAERERLKPGDEVVIFAADYAQEPSAGRLVHVGPDELVLERRDERAGRVMVHFPRFGFIVKARA